MTFSVGNDGGAAVSVTDVEFGTTNAADYLHENNGGAGAGQHEVYVSSPSTAGRYEAGDGNPNQDRYSLESRVPLSTLVTIQPGDDATFSLVRFYDDQPGNSDPQVDMQSEELTVTLYFADGSQRTFSFTVAPF